MKKLTYIFAAAALLAFAASCEQELVDNTASPCPSNDPSIICPDAEQPACPPDASAGDANFSKFVALGSSYTAGFQAGALFNEGQANSLAAILATQFECVGGGAFNQPTINSENGFNLFVSPNPMGEIVLGRFKLQGTPPQPAPVISGPEALPSPLNPAFMYSGNKAALNNFAVPVTFLRQLFAASAGDWNNPDPSAGFTPFYARFASDPSNSTIIGDAAAAQPTFFMMWSGMDDYLLYAAYGGDQKQVPPPTPVEGGIGVGFAATYGAAVATLLGSGPDVQGVVANFPSVFALPHFTLVAYNPIPLDGATAAMVNASYAGYNQILDALKTAPFNFPAEDVDARKISFAEGNNAFVIIDETLTDYGDAFDMLLQAEAISPEQRAALVPYEQVRQTTSSDIIPLSTGSVLGTLADPNNPLSIRGVAVPLGDQYALIPSEVAAIEGARVAYNTAIAGVVSNYPEQLALADVNAGISALLTAQAGIANNLTFTPNINPPTGIYSEDGMHPNSRGYAFIANIFIDAINAKFDAKVPRVNLANYSATGLPVNP